MNNTALLFAGQGAQTVGMGKDLADRFPEAKAWFERANAALGYDLAGICFHGPEGELTKTENAQPGIFLVGWVAFKLLTARLPSLQVSAMAGLSLGEFTALAAAGAFSFETGLGLVRQRGIFMQAACDATRGSMAAIIGLPVAATEELCAETGIELANLNCPGQIVISGETERLNRACEVARKRGAKRVIPLTVAGAYHSKLMAGAQPKLQGILTTTPVQPPSVPVLSNVTAQPHGGSDEIRRGLVEQITSPVRWEDSMRYLVAGGVTRFIELGPGKALTGFMKRIDAHAELFNVADIDSLEQTVRALGAPAV
ncbi:MAG: ACP S-malonyltransferase [Candidatus Omnitrophica bacterium]|nr:ACP S-malonyltransferase [Candidatus Omnitrophota bacterium]